MGVSLKLMNVLQSMYANMTSRVVANNNNSSFPCLKEVRQGCNLSPLVISLFISDLESYRLMNLAGSITLVSRKVQLLLFADDLVLLVESIKGLLDSVDRLAEFCKACKLNDVSVRKLD